MKISVLKMVSTVVSYPIFIATPLPSTSLSHGRSTPEFLELISMFRCVKIKDPEEDAQVVRQPVVEVYISNLID